MSWLQLNAVELVSSFQTLQLAGIYWYSQQWWCHYSIWIGLVVSFLHIFMLYIYSTYVIMLLNLSLPKTSTLFFCCLPFTGISSRKCKSSLLFMGLTGQHLCASMSEFYVQSERERPLFWKSKHLNMLRKSFLRVCNRPVPHQFLCVV